MTVTKIETNFKRNLFWNVTSMKFNKELKNIENGLISVYPDAKFQSIIGFGGAFTESSGYCLSQLNSLMADTLLNEYFLDSGLNYSFCRTPIGSCDFSLSSYSYSKKENLEDFSIEQDEKYIIPMIKSAFQKNPNLKLLASPWSPPAFMKSNRKLILGGKLLEKYYDLYAEYLTKYILEYQKKNIPISYITIQNEPKAMQIWESCLYSAEEEAEFANKLYEKFQENGIKTKILAWDHNKERLYNRSKTIFKMAEKAVSGMAIHWYSGDYFEEISLTQNRYPDKLLIHTEGCTGFSHFKKQDEVINAEIYGHAMLNNLSAGIHGFIDWNLILDHKGGPNHKYNYCNAPIMINKDKTGYIKNLTYYYIGHFSKFIKPGAKRIGISKFTSDLETVAFQNDDESIVVILLNRNDFNIEFNLHLNGKIFHDNLDSHAIVSFVINI